MDVIYVPVQAADGWALVPHSPEEYACLVEGVDWEAVEGAVGPLEEPEG